MSAIAFHTAAETIGPRTVEVQLNGRAHAQWLASVAHRLNELASWVGADPRGSRPMNVQDLDSALTFMQLVMRPDTASPWIGLLNTGGLQVNWRVDDVEVEAVFDSTRGDEMVYVTVGDNEWESPADAAYSLFASVADRLSAPDLDRSAVV
jgi:hypothetical protein